MPRISRSAGIETFEAHSAIELIVGEDQTFDRVFLDRDGSAADLTGAILHASAENYLADAVITASRSASSLAISNFEPTGTPIGDVEIYGGGADGSYQARLNPFTIPLVENPQLDAVRTAVSVISVRATWSPTRIRINRFLCVWRRGLP